MSKENKQKSDEEKRLDALEKKLGEVLSGVYEADARVMLWQFIKGFTIKKYHDDATGIKKWYYKVIGFPLFVDGIIRDVRVNSTTGKMLFGKFAKFGTLTDTLIRVKEAKLSGHSTYIHNEYGYIRKDKYDLALQICEALSDSDEGHC